MSVHMDGLPETAWQARWLRGTVKTLLVLLAAGLSVAFFGICVPFFLLAMQVLPSLGVGGVVYVLAGGLFGLLFGGIASARSLARSPRLLPRSYLILTGALAAAVLIYWVCYLNIERLSRNL
jgi:hypothetical protein